MTVCRAEGFAVRRWLQLGAASAGMGAALWGLSVAGPQTGVAAADTGGESSASSSASGSDGSRSVRPVRAVRSADKPRSTQRSADKPRDTQRSTDTDDEDEDDEDEKETRPDRAPDLKAERPDRDVTEASSEPVMETANTSAAQSVSTPAAVPSSTRSWQSPYQHWVARSLDAWTDDSLSWIGSLQTSDRTKEQLEASFFTIRRTFFNQAPTIDPVQISGVLDGPVTGTLGAHDPDGDRLIYVLTRGPRSGTVDLHRDGTFTYTPGDDFDGVDAFRVTAIDIGFHTNLLEPLRPVGSNPLRSLINQGAVKFAFDYVEGAEYWTSEHRDALQRSADALILYFRVLNPVVLRYNVEGEDDRDPSASLASAGSALAGGEPGYWNTVVQRKLLSGVDPNGAAADGEITWNFGYSWGLGDTVGADEYDFQSTAMHELLHSFGFLSMTSEPGDNTGRLWTTLDRYLVTAGGRHPINRNLEWDTDYDGYLIGQDGGLYLGGRHARAAYGAAVPIYTPSPWWEGSSGSHTDDVTFAGAGQLMMNAMTGTGPAARLLSALEVGILRDLGYTMVPVSR